MTLSVKIHPVKELLRNLCTHLNLRCSFLLREMMEDRLITPVSRGISSKVCSKRAPKTRFGNGSRRFRQSVPYMLEREIIEMKTRSDRRFTYSATAVDKYDDEYIARAQNSRDAPGGMAVFRLVYAGSCEESGVYDNRST